MRKITPALAQHRHNIQLMFDWLIMFLELPRSCSRTWYKRSWFSAGLMLGRRLRRRPNIKPALDQPLGYLVSIEMFRQRTLPPGVGDVTGQWMRPTGLDTDTHGSINSGTPQGSTDRLCIYEVFVISNPGRSTLQWCPPFSSHGSNPWSHTSARSFTCIIPLRIAIHAPGTAMICRNPFKTSDSPPTVSCEDSMHPLNTAITNQEIFLIVI